MPVTPTFSPPLLLKQIVQCEKLEHVACADSLDQNEENLIPEILAVAYRVMWNIL